MLVSSELWVPITSRSFVCLHLLVSEIHVANVLPDGVYCCFTRSILFTTMLIVVYSLKCMYACVYQVSS